MTLAVVVIASEKRAATTFWPVMESILAEKPDEVVVVADFHMAGYWRHLMIPAFTKSTIDALVKRDVGLVATKSDTVCFLSDDHRLMPGFVESYYENYALADWDILAPSRCALKDGVLIPLNMGQAERYVAGHGGLYRRRCGTILPWTATIPHRNWDQIISHYLVANGAKLAYAGPDLAIEDIEGGTPWI